VQLALWVPLAIAVLLGTWFGLGTFPLVLIALWLALIWFFVIQKFSSSYVTLLTTGEDAAFTFASRAYALKFRELNPTALGPPPA
jgi:fatty acid desaturase